MRWISHGRPTRLLIADVADWGLSHWRVISGVGKMVWSRVLATRVERSLSEEYRPPPLKRSQILLGVYWTGSYLRGVESVFSAPSLHLVQGWNDSVFVGSGGDAGVFQSQWTGDYFIQQLLIGLVFPFAQAKCKKVKRQRGINGLRIWLLNRQGGIHHVDNFWE